VGQGSAMVMPYDSQHNIFRWNHAFLPAHVRCWTDPSPDMFLRSIHGGNDSTRTVPEKAQRGSRRGRDRSCASASASRPCASGRSLRACTARCDA
jgi:hypothetical protein